jgi:transcriptional regulator with GAF, ATPase, and Fis domain
VTTRRSGPARARDRARTFLVGLADTLSTDFDSATFLNDFVNGCVVILGVDSVGLLLEVRPAILEVAAFSGEPARLLGQLEAARGAGPGTECYRTGRPVQHSFLAPGVSRWPQLSHVARAAGAAALHAIPMRRREQTIGALTLITGDCTHPSRDGLENARLLADAATIGLLTHRIIQRHKNTSEQLQTALTSRIVIEQAKGVLAGRLGITVDEAFEMLRRHARSRNLKLHQAAAAVIDGDPSILS